MSKLLIAMLLLSTISGCEVGPHKHSYVATERGLISFDHAYCELGLLLNNDRYNILDEDSKPVTCTGYVTLTEEEAMQYGQ